MFSGWCQAEDNYRQEGTENVLSVAKVCLGCFEMQTKCWWHQKSGERRGPVWEEVWGQPISEAN